MAYPPDRYDEPPPGEVYPEPEPPDYRGLVVAYMESQLGASDPRPYWLEVHGSIPVPARGKRIHWCGALALCALRHAGLCDWMWSFDPESPGFIWRIGWHRATRNPQPGDVVYVEHAQHHAIVSGPMFERNGQIIVPSIDGNTGDPPGIVARSRGRPLLRRDVHYYDITGLIGDALALALRDTDPVPPPESR